MGRGDYMAINHNHATTYVASPYDEKILQLNQNLNQTYVDYGSIGRQKMTLQSEQDANAEGYSNANAVSRTVSKSSHLYKNESWDLVDADKNKSFKYDELKERDLPTEFKGKSTAQIKAYVAKKSKDRDVIQQDIQNLNEKRRAYIFHQQKEDDIDWKMG